MMTAAATSRPSSVRRRALTPRTAFGLGEQQGGERHGAEPTGGRRGRGSRPGPAGDTMTAMRSPRRPEQDGAIGLA